MNEITIKQEEVRLPDGCLKRVRLTKYDGFYTVYTQQNGENIICTPWELDKDGWRNCMWTNHKDITCAMKEYTGRLESLKKRGF